MSKRLIFILLLVGGMAYADDSMIKCMHQGGGGFYDDILKQIQEPLTKWRNLSTTFTYPFFTILFITEFMWQLAVKKVFSGDIEKLWVFFFTRAILCAFLTKYVINIDLYEGIITYIAQQGAATGGYGLNLLIGGSSVTTTHLVTPSELASSYSCVADKIDTMTNSTGAMSYIATKLSLAIMEVLLLIIFSYLAFCVMRVLVHTYFVLYVGFILCGFAGSSWTQGYWSRYTRAIGECAIKFLAVSFILGVIMSTFTTWGKEISNATNITDIMTAVIHALGSAFILALLLHDLPDWAASTLASEIQLFVNNKAGISGSSGSYGGSSSATNAVLNKLNSNLSKLGGKLSPSNVASNVVSGASKAISSASNKGSNNNRSGPGGAFKNSGSSNIGRGGSKKSPPSDLNNLF